MQVAVIMLTMGVGMDKSRRQAYLLLVGYLVRVASGFNIYDLRWPTDCKAFRICTLMVISILFIEHFRSSAKNFKPAFLFFNMLLLMWFLGFYVYDLVKLFVIF
ncbi:unnamed protein product [Musa acuminata var. zebrina]